MKKGKRIRVLCTFFCFQFFMGTVLFAQESRVTLEQCIQQALEANYSIKIVRNQEYIADNNANYAPFLPLVGIDVQQTQRLNDTKTTVSGEDRKVNGATSDVLSAGVSFGRGNAENV